MKVRKSIAAAGVAAVVLGTAGATTLPALASTQRAVLTFTSVTTGTVPFTPTTAGVADTDVNAAGATIGYDVVYGVVTGKTTATSHVAFTFSGGLLFGTVTTMNSNKTFKGPVIGGTGAFARARGTIEGTSLGGGRTAVTIRLG